MADRVVLLDFWPSPFGMRLRIALAEKGVKYEYKEEDLMNKSPLLLQSNPVHKKIPVLIHNGKSVSESVIALQYIDEVWNDKAPLLPLILTSNPKQSSGLTSSTRRYMFWGRKHGRLKEKNRRPHRRNSLNALKPECPKFIAWAKRCLEKESVSKSLPDQDKVCAFVAEMRKTLGME
ncbi:hypothetical protein M0R45_014407 [Rubus argutus]|uniref:Glutathione S-transferase n=1 Tax=Rubus argutus TaxID=59490 RepID=A0AAW1XM57_RUBAR